MHRRLTKGACGPLLGACVLIAVVWAGSYRSFAMVQPGVSAGATRWALISYRGLLAVSVMPNYPVQPTISDLLTGRDPEMLTALNLARTVDKAKTSADH